MRNNDTAHAVYGNPEINHVTYEFEKSGKIVHINCKLLEIRDGCYIFWGYHVDVPLDVAIIVSININSIDILNLP